METNPTTPVETTEFVNRKVWEGFLVWKDTVNNEQQKSLQCEISCSRDQPGMTINAQTWPNQLLCKFIPQHLLQKLKQFFTNSIWMTFNFQNSQTNERSSLVSLYEQLTKERLIIDIILY
jgi:hypothetical protein